MKNSMIFAAVALVLTGSASCSKDGSEVRLDEAALRLNLLCSSPVTRAAADPMTGEGRENYIGRIDYFFFADEESQPLYSSTYTPEDKMAEKHSFTVRLEDEGVPNADELFPHGSAIFYAVANYTGDLSGKTLSQIKGLAVGDTHGTYAEVIAEGSEKYFVMTAEKRLSASTKEVDIPLKRLTAKLSLTLDFGTEPIETVDGDKTTTWTPMYEVARVRLEKEARQALLGAGAAKSEGATFWLPDDLGLANTEYLRYAEDNLTQTHYSYPQRWEEGAADAPALKLILRWGIETRKDGVVTYKGISDERYYKIMLPGGITSLNANCWYRLTAAVRVSPAEKEPLVELEAFTVLHWNDSGEDLISSIIPDVKYISPERSSVTFYGTSTTISYIASGPVEMSIDKIYQVKYTSSGAAETVLILSGAPDEANIATLCRPDGARLTADDVRGWVSYDDVGKTLSINHRLIDDFTKSYFDATPYVYVLRLHLTGEAASYDKVVTLTQNPNFVRRQIQSNKNVFVNKTGAPKSGTSPVTSDNKFRGYYNSGWKTSNALGRVYSESEVLTSANNKSEFLHIVSAAISDDIPVLDPRMIQEDNLRFGSTTTTGATLSGLTNYHSTRDDIHGVAPLFIIASSYGKTAPVRYNEAVVRCAAYQENGYPAGRWRIPTEEEINFLQKLNANKKIEDLFYSKVKSTKDESEEGYWASSGRFYSYHRKKFSNQSYIGESATQGMNQYVRCVYDAWYWGEEPLDDNGKPTTNDKAAKKWLGYDFANKMSN
ncbi:MAG: hypothetical protein IJ721_09775 [Bacteroidales bacterium]|nr:hypothetical protein [Bacteroidales bacterium]